MRHSPGDCPDGLADESAGNPSPTDSTQNGPDWQDPPASSFVTPAATPPPLSGPLRVNTTLELPTLSIHDAKKQPTGTSTRIGSELCIQSSHEKEAGDLDCESPLLRESVIAGLDSPRGSFTEGGGWHAAGSWDCAEIAGIFTARHMLEDEPLTATLQTQLPVVPSTADKCDGSSLTFKDTRQLSRYRVRKPDFLEMSETQNEFDNLETATQFGVSPHSIKRRWSVTMNDLCSASIEKRSLAVARSLKESDDAKGAVETEEEAESAQRAAEEAGPAMTALQKSEARTRSAENELSVLRGKIAEMKEGCLLFMREQEVEHQEALLAANGAVNELKTQVRELQWCAKNNIWDSVVLRAQEEQHLEELAAGDVEVKHLKAQLREVQKVNQHRPQRPQVKEQEYALLAHGAWLIDTQEFSPTPSDGPKAELYNGLDLGAVAKAAEPEQGKEPAAKQQAAKEEMKPDTEAARRDEQEQEQEQDSMDFLMRASPLTTPTSRSLLKKRLKQNHVASLTELEESAAAEQVYQEQAAVTAAEASHTDEQPNVLRRTQSCLSKIESTKNHVAPTTPQKPAHHTFRRTKSCDLLIPKTSQTAVIDRRNSDLRINPIFARTSSQELLFNRFTSSPSA